MSDINLEVFFDDLTADARQWDDVADAIAEAVRLVETSTALSRWVVDGLSFAAGFQRDYDAGRNRCVDYLNEGRQYLQTIGPTLRDIRDAYKGSDEYSTWLLNRAAKEG